MSAPAIPPAVNLLPELIVGRDNFEVVRDLIAVLIFENQAQQQVLAVGADEDPAQWALAVYIERSRPWESYLATADIGSAPIVNVWYESGNFPEDRGDVVERQTHSGAFNVDCYGFGVSGPDPNDPAGQIIGDEVAALTAQRAVRLCRNILMAAENTYLQRPPTIGNRWVAGINSFQPELDVDAAVDVVGMRLQLRVEFDEFSPQVAGQPLEEIGVVVNRASDGLLIAEAEYRPTP